MLYFAHGIFSDFSWHTLSHSFYINLKTLALFVYNATVGVFGDINFQASS